MWDVPYCPMHPLGTKGWDGQLGHRAEMWDSMGRPLHPLGTKGWDGQLGHRAEVWDSMRCPLLSHTPLGDSWDTGLKCGTPWDVPYCPIHPSGTKGWDGQLEHRAEVWDSMGRPLLSHTSLRD